jgi:hypothetical protein
MTRRRFRSSIPEEIPMRRGLRFCATGSALAVLNLAVADAGAATITVRTPKIPIQTPKVQAHPEPPLRRKDISVHFLEGDPDRPLVIGNTSSSVKTLNNGAKTLRYRDRK